MKKILSLTFVLSLFLVACDNEESSQDNLTPSGTISVESEVSIEETEEVIDNIVLYSESVYGITSKTTESTSKEEGKRGRSGFFKDCADITVEETETAVTTTIVFSGECEDFDGNVITGTITKVREKTDNSRSKTITLTDVTINGRVVNGTKTYTFVQENNNGNPEMNGSVDITVVTEDGTTAKAGSRTVEITAGGDTDSWMDDEKTITGSCTYTNAEGTVFSATITTALVKPAKCRYIASGVKEYNKDGEITTIDFGDGTCDNLATKTLPDGTTKEITLRKKRKH